MRRRSGALVLGGVLTAAALAFGSRPLAVVGLGILLAAGSTEAWAGLVRGHVSMHSSVDPVPATEGDRVRLRFDVRRGSRVPVGSAAVSAALGGLGTHEARLRGHGRRLTGCLELGALPRGVFPLTGVELLLGDLIGLGSIAIPAGRAATSVVVQPRLVDLPGLFSDAGAAGESGRRHLLRRPAGFDFHSVRDYEPGESLRRVHWPTTARRGRLMVKELHDTPHDEIVVLLDCDPAGAAGDPPCSSFDDAVRAAGSILRVHANRLRAVTLVTTGREAAAAAPVRSSVADLGAALAVLAAAEPDAARHLSSALAAELPAVARAGELVVVTAAPARAVAGPLLRHAVRRPVSLVWVDAPSYVGRPTRADPGVLRLASAGIAVAVVRHGDDLAGVLGPRSVERLARG
jgi:uncharacterized protein (DUF58 family)